MYNCKIVICDDEKMIRDGLSGFIKNFFPEAKISGVFSDGTQVIEHLSKENFDILITDIKMNNQNGIETVKKLREMKKNIPCILITGYEDFEYAKRAIDLKVSALITKPIDFELLADAVREAIVSVKRSISEVIVEDALLLKSYSNLRSGLAALWNDEVTVYNFIQRLDARYGYILNCPVSVIDFNTLGGKSVPENSWSDFGVDDNEDYSTVCIFSDKVGAKLVYFSKTNNKSYEEFCCEIEKSFMSLYGVSVEYKAENFLSLAFAVNRPEHKLFIKYKKSILEHNDSERADTVNLIINNLGHSQILGIIKETAEEYGLLSIITEAENTKEKSQVASIFKKLDSEILREESQDDNNTAIIKDCIDYINKNYGDDISLETISEKYHISASHFSRMFKRVTGSNYKNYTMQLRLEKAAELLRTGKYKVKEASFKVGFDNPTYFGQVFKKYYGYTPSDFLRLRVFGRGQQQDEEV